MDKWTEFCIQIDIDNIQVAEFTKVEKTLQDIRFGNLPDFTRPTTT